MEAKKSKSSKRPPIVVVLGHVDHGKTTLLDALRKTSVAQKEAGGITQSIGASVVETQSGEKITFIDTPGHALFSKMRGRGAKIADIAILVVACGDGVKPQTKEAIEIVKESKIPFIVAATKSDIAGVSSETVKAQLEAEGILFEGRGGETPFIPVSAKNNIGLKELLETIALLSEINGVSGDASAPLEALVVESLMDRRGNIVNLIVRNGSLRVGDEVKIENLSGKVRGLFNEKGEAVREILPGYPAQAMGLAEEEFKGPRNVLGGARKLKEDELPLVIKASNAGSLEAVIASLPEKTVVVGRGVGDVNESDVLDAKTGDARILAFEAKIPGSVAKLAEAEGVRVKRFDIIYELIQEVEDIFKKGKLETVGKANIVASFPFDGRKVAGCKSVFGKIAKGDKIQILRNEKEVGKGKIISLRKQKNEVAVVGQGEEFGALIEPQLDFAVGDVLVSVR